MNLSITAPPSRSLACQVPYLEVSVVSDVQQAMEAVLSGMLLFLAEEDQEACLIDARSYPVRSMQEPEDDRYCGVPAMPSLKRWFSIPC